MKRTLIIILLSFFLLSNNMAFCAAGLQTGTDSNVSVLATSTAVLSASTTREYIALVNDSDEVIYISFNGTDATLNKGLRLNPNGGNVEWIYPVIPHTAIYAICASGSKNLTVHTGE